MHSTSIYPHKDDKLPLASVRLWVEPGSSAHHRPLVVVIAVATARLLRHA